jgi:hypothetical protein
MYGFGDAVDVFILSGEVVAGCPVAALVGDFGSLVLP